MDHAEVLDRLEAAMVGPGKLAAIESDLSLAGIELRSHLEGCDACSREYRAWWVAARALAEVTPDSLRAPADARERILAAVTASGRKTAVPRAAIDVRPATGDILGTPAHVPAPTDVPAPTHVSPRTPDPSVRVRPAQLRPRAPSPAWLGLAAAAAVLVFVLGAFLGGPLGLSPAPPSASERPVIPLTIARAVDRILRQPEHRQVTLVGPSGEAAGSLLFDPTSRELVVFSDRLPQAAAGGEYECYLERAGDRTWVGSMGTSDGFSFWAGPLDELADAGLPGDRFLVVEEGSTGPPALAADL